MGDLRVRIEFEACIGRQQIFLRHWFQASQSSTTVQDLMKQIASRYRLKTSQILLSLRGFYLTPDTPITFLRDGDIIVVTADNKLEVAGTALDLDLRSLLEVSQNSLPPRSLLQTRTNDPSPKKLSAESPSQKRARPKERPAVPKQMPQRPLTKKQRLDINSKAGIPSNGEKPQESDSTTNSSSSETDSSSEDNSYHELPKENPPPDVPQPMGKGENKGGERKTPSRNALRKKNKRKLIRQGILPRPLSKLGRLQLTPEALPHLPAPPRLPKRGDVIAAQPELAEFMATGHVRFVDSDDDDMPQQSPKGSRIPTMQTESSSQDQIVVAAAALQMNEGPQAQERSAAPAEVNQLECRECVSAHRIMSLNAQDSASRAKIRAFKPNYNAVGPPQYSPKTAVNPTIERGYEAPSANSTIAIDYEALSRIEGAPASGSVIAYKLLELDPSMCPVVSNWRCGRVIDYEEENGTLTAEPWPDKHRHPLERFIREEDEDQEGGPSSQYYDDAGKLTASVLELVEFRLVAGPSASSSKVQEPNGMPGEQREGQRETQALLGSPKGEVRGQSPSLYSPMSGLKGTTDAPIKSLDAAVHQQSPSNSPQNSVHGMGNHLRPHCMLPRAVQSSAASIRPGQRGSTPWIRPIPRMQRSTPLSQLGSTAEAIQGQQSSPVVAMPFPVSNGKPVNSQLCASSPHVPEIAVALAERRRELRASMEPPPGAHLQTAKDTALTNGIAKIGSTKETQILENAVATPEGSNGTGGPGAVKPRPGVRGVALGPFLERLRQTNSLH